MKHLFPRTALCLAMVAAPALAAACPWADGTYHFSEHGIYGDFTVNANCTQLVWSRSSDGPETTSLQRTKRGWKGTLERADFELLENGHSLTISDPGGISRPARAERTN